MSDVLKDILKRALLTTILKMGAITATSYFVMTYLIKKLDHTYNQQKEAAKSKAESQLKKLGITDLKLTEHELLIASHLVIPEDITVSWNDIAGLEDVLTEIYETVIFPIKNRGKLSNSMLTHPPKGVLLYGPPGCGKTLIAKATAKEAATSFLCLDISMLTDKWYGESQKLVTALFSLAAKLQPCIIFIDEIDSLLRTRNSQDHEATAMMKAQFMFLWDGLNTDPEKFVIVMGATNRPDDLDAAIMRRMPAKFCIAKPNSAQRVEILKLILKKEVPESMEFEELVSLTEGFSGSELHELCRNGSFYRIRECARRDSPAEKDMNSSNQSAEAEEDKDSFKLRLITMEDLKKALKSMRASKYIDSHEMIG